MVQKMKQRTINKNVAGIYDLTAMQSGMIYHKLLDETSSEYFLQQSFQLKGIVDEEKLLAGIQLLNKKHESLRTIFLYRKAAKPRQIVLNEKEQETTVIDLSAYEAAVQQEMLQEIKEQDITRGFDLEKDSLLRVTFVRMDKEKTIMIWSAHHIILDGWCFSILFKDFIYYYNKLLTGESLQELAAVAIQESKSSFSFKDYVSWQKQQDLSAGMDYWKRTLSDYSEVAEIRSMYTGDTADTQQVRTEKVTLDEAVSRQLHQATLSMQITMSSLMETAWGITLQKYNWTQDVVFGKIVSGRNAPLRGIEQAVGLFINTIPVRVDARENQTPAQLLQAVQQQAADSSSFDYFSLADVQQQSELGGDLFKTLLMYENYFDADSFQETMMGIDVEPDSMREQTNYPIAMKVYHSTDTESLSLEALYDPKLYGNTEMQQLLETFKTILSHIALKPEEKISEIQCLGEKEMQKVLHTFNDTKTPFAKGQTMVELFEAEVEKTPDKVALVFKEQQVTYQELNQRANHLAAQLRELGIQPDDRVALFTARSVELLIAMLGVIKAGGAYVPIDPSFPEERIQYMLEDSESKVVLTAHHTFPLVVDLPVIEVTDRTAAKELPMMENLPTVNTPTDLFCCLYTSGTTGKPKGVMLEHRNIVNYCTGKMAFGDSFMSHPEPTFVSVTTYCFDIFIKESFLPLLNQIKIIMADEEEQESQYLLAQLVEKHQANLLVTTPSKMKMFMMDESNRSYMRHFTTIILGGEVFPGTLYEQMRENTDARIFNMCGPTEATVLIVTHEITDSGYIPLGKPVPNNQIYVMNQGQLCGVGMPGELCIAGENLGRGYMKRPDLTAEKFVPNPFGPGQLYHAGDLVRWLPNGDLEYLGRIDEQVKIRGFRVELGEIESVLRKQEAISNAAVIVKNDRNGDRAIHAYMVSDQLIDFQHIREILREELPEFMIPPYMMQIDRIPVTPTGKVSRRELPEIHTTTDDKQVVAPVNELQQIIADIFSEVLNVEEVSITDNFFEIGGHSLRATQVINKLEAVTSVRLPLRMLFSSPTVEQLSEVVEQQKEEAGYEPIPKAKEQEYYPMSSAQRRIYVMNELNDLGVAYNLPAAIRFNGKLEVSKVKSAFEQLMQRHEILRTSFHTIDGEAVQKIHEQITIDFTHELVLVSEKELSHLFDCFVQPFDLSHAPLLRIQLSTISENQHVLFFDIHHIIADAVSISQLFEEFSVLYNDSHAVLPEYTVSYKDYSQWFADREQQEHQNFWKEHFSGELPVLDLPLDHQRPIQPTYKGAMLKRALAPELKDGIIQLAQQHGATEYMVLLSACMLLLHKHSRQEDIIVGTSISGRIHKDTEKILGMFVNTLAMRGKPTPEKHFTAFLEEIKEESLKAYEHQEYPFEEVVEDLALSRDFSRNPLFDVMFVLQNNEAAKINLKDVEVEELTLNHPAAKFDLTFNLIEKNAGYELSVEYATDLFEEETIIHMITHYEQLLSEVVKNAERSIHSLSALSAEEELLVLQTFNDTAAPSAKGKTMVELFEAQAAQTPDKVAIVFKDQQVTYSELNQRANCLAWYLRSMGIKPDDRVALFTARSVELLVAMLGVIKAGGAYVPIDPSYPEDRIKYMLDDSEAKAILTAYRELPLAVDIPVIEVTAPESDCALPGVSNLAGVNTPTDLFCCLYTSGTTGKPKGVMLEHRNIVNYCTGKMAFGDSFMSHPEPTFVSVTTYCFDIFIKESFLPLLNQIKIIMADEEEQESQHLLAQLVEKHQANLLVTTPSKMKMFMMDESNCSYMRHFTTIILGGEVFPGSLYEQMRRNTDARIFNMCGPTEATVLIVTHEVTDSSYIPLGKPVPNNQIYVMDQGELCGVGLPGELCIAGENLGRGYMKRPDLTAEKFVPNPFGPGQLYHAGDLVRWLPNGDLEYLGRIDEQVKIRGLRVELGEIESVLRRQDNISNAAVVVKPDHTEEPAIHAYLVSQKALDLSTLREALRQELPDFMVPPYMMQLEDIPVTPTGKVDKRRLPQIEISNEREYVAPNNEIEQSLVDVFENVLAVSPIGITDSFFELGGDSIKAIRAVSKMREKGYEVSVKDIMQLYTVQSISLRISMTAPTISYDQLELSGPAAMTPVQKHFFKTAHSQPEHFNQSLMLMAAVRLDQETLRTALEAVITHHDQLRSVYRNGEQIILRAEESGLIELHIVDWKNETSVADKIKEENTRVQASMDLEQGPLVKAVLYQLKEEDHLFISIHHLVVDAVSWQVILEDLATSYQLLLRNEAVQLPEKTASFDQWAKTLEQYGQSKELQKEVAFWQQLSDDINGLASTDHSIESKTGIYDEASTALEQETTEALLYHAGKAYGTEINDLLLTALSRSAAKLLGRDKLSIQLESHGRENLKEFPAIDRTVGWFTSLYPLLLTNYSEMEKTIIQTKEALYKVPNNGLGYGVIKYNSERMLPKITTDIAFNYLGNNSNQPEELLQPSIYSTGNAIAADNKMDQALTVNCSIIDKQLKTTIIYDSTEYSAAQIKQFYEAFNESLRDLTRHCLAQEERVLTASDYQLDMPLEEFQQVQKLVPLEKTDSVYPLSPMQSGILYHKLKNDRSGEYFMQQILRLSVPADNETLIQSFKLLKYKYPVLRTKIVFKDLITPVQVVLNDLDLEAEVVEQTKGTSADFIAADVERGFDFDNDSLIRLTILRSPNETLLIWSAHHIILDGWCFPILFKDFMENYQALTEGQRFETIAERAKEEERGLPNYQEYIQWQREQDREEALTYWRELLVDYSEAAEILPTLGRREETQEQVADAQLTLTEEEGRGLQELSVKNQLTMSSILETAWGLTLQRLNHTKDAVFGKVVSGRNVPLTDIEKAVGLFINTVPVRVNGEEERSVLNLLKEVQQQSIESSSYDHLSLAEVQQQSSLGSDLFKTLFIFENYYIDEEVRQSVEQGTAFETHAVREQTNYPITLKAFMAEQLTIEVLYDPTIYTNEEIQLVLKRMKQILQGILKEPELSIRQLSLLDEEEAKLVSVDFNDTQTPSGKGKTVVELFEIEAANVPDKVALVFKDQEITYAMLNQRANQLAVKLRSMGLQPDDRVALFTARSVELLVAMLGVIKAGGAYVPIDPSYPEDRIRYMLEDSEPKAILTAYRELPVSTTIPIIELHKNEELTQLPTDNLTTVNSPTDLFCCLYTSGTTGKPKGAMLEHRNIVNYCTGKMAFGDSFFNHEEPTFVSVTTYCFDVFIKESFLPLLNQIKIVLADEEQQESQDLLAQLVEKTNANLLVTTPSKMKMFMMDDENCQYMRHFTTIILGGEVFPASLFEQMRRHTNARIFNMCGPTEATVLIVTHEITDSSYIALGKPVPNNQIYVMNDGQLCGVGVPGELCITGENLGRGYMKRPDLTAEKFVPSPFGAGQLYHAGDLVRWLPNGDLEYMGRIDEQVKIRGLRVELGEIESVLRKQTQISNAAVVVKPDHTGESAIHAYMVSQEELVFPQLREALREELPDYMVPPYMMQLEQIPVTATGKVDKRSLPEIELKTDRQYEAPQGMNEEMLAGMFETVLGIAQVSRSDDFFELGGDSIKAISILSMLTKKRIKLSVRDIFQYRTIKELGSKIAELQKIKTAVEEELTESEPNEQGQAAPSIEQQMEQLLTEIKGYSGEILSGKAMMTNELSASQKALYKMDVLGSFGRIHVEKPWNKEEFSNVWNILLKEQQILRSQIDPRKLEITVFDWAQIGTIPFIDLSIYPSENRSEYLKAIEEQVECYSKPEYELQDDIAHHMLVVKQSRQTYEVLLPVSHLIFDGFSSEVLNARFHELLAMKQPKIAAIPQYESYTDLLNQGPVATSEPELIDALELRTFDQALTSYHAAKAAKEYTWITYHHDMQEVDLAEDEGFKLAERLYLTALQHAFPDIDVPLLMIQIGRSYGQQQFTEQIGSFIDLLPITFTTGQNQTLTEKSRAIMSYMSMHHVHLLSLMENQELQKMYPNAADIVGKINLTNLPAQIVNFLMMFDQENSLFDERQLLEENKAVGTSNSRKVANILHTKERIVLTNLECERGTEKELLRKLDKELENYIRSLRNK
ncbi:amino acid adenylation domain-containing protein [Enterococcus larvae]|uniref:amino acid adenylation domain-containing protein n=1 Tax=Enterococcus larvae TaxID=2794352 RepID=UPI003F2AA5AB